VPDLLAEKTISYSPYVYVKNNPIMLVDPNGLKDSTSTSKPVSSDVEKAAQEGKSQGSITPEAPATPIYNADGTINTDAYNCHSYAWDNSQGDPSDPANAEMVAAGVTKWDNDPLNNTDGYKPIPFDQANQPGDRVIYYAVDKDGNVVPTHSAVVSKVDKNGNTTEVTSKWGQLGVYKLHPRDVPSSYSADAPTATTANGTTYATRVYYRSTSSSSVPSTQSSSSSFKPNMGFLPAVRNTTYVAPPVIIPLRR